MSEVLLLTIELRLLLGSKDSEKIKFFLLIYSGIFSFVSLFVSIFLRVFFSSCSTGYHMREVLAKVLAKNLVVWSIFMPNFAFLKQ